MTTPSKRKSKTGRRTVASQVYDSHGHIKWKGFYLAVYNIDRDKAKRLTELRKTNKLTDSQFVKCKNPAEFLVKNWELLDIEGGWAYWDNVWQKLKTIYNPESIPE